MTIRATDIIALLILVAYLYAGGESLAPVDSPLPADGGPWLIVGAETGDLSGVEVAANAEEIRLAFGERRRVLDWQKEIGEPWGSARDWIQEKGGGDPYYAARNGRRAVDGPIEGTVGEQYQTLLAAWEAIQ